MFPKSRHCRGKLHTYFSAVYTFLAPEWLCGARRSKPAASHRPPTPLPHASQSSVHPSGCFVMCQHIFTNVENLFHIYVICRADRHIRRRALHPVCPVPTPRTCPPQLLRRRRGGEPRPPRRRRWQRRRCCPGGRRCCWRTRSGLASTRPWRARSECCTLRTWKMSCAKRGRRTAGEVSLAVAVAVAVPVVRVGSRSCLMEQFVCACVCFLH